MRGLMEYRPEIDGLRAVAVVPVILFHAGFRSFAGGFIGVDVFFVISGYLITTIILSDMDKGAFSLATFYERRARRILPALFAVILCCLPGCGYCPTTWRTSAKASPPSPPFHPISCSGKRVGISIQPQN